MQATLDEVAQLNSRLATLKKAVDANTSALAANKWHLIGRSAFS